MRHDKVDRRVLATRPLALVGYIWVKHEIGVRTFPMALKFDRHLGSSAVEMPVTFQSYMII